MSATEVAKVDSNAARVAALLESRYPEKDGWAFYHEIRSHTGWSNRGGRTNFLDAFAMNVWPSEGRTRHAFEIKVARSDWLKENDDPSKRKAGMALAHHFWYVAPPGIIRPTEVPAGCGLMEATAGGLRVAHAAPWRDVPPLPEDFVASLLRAGQARARTRPETLAAFRYAGRELTAADLLKLAANEIQTEANRRVHEAVRAREADWKATSAEALLARAVAEAMGPGWAGPWRGLPTPDDFRRWRAAQLGDGPTVSPEMKRIIRRADHALAQLRECMEELDTQTGKNGSS